MANNYTQFAEVLTFDTDEERKWFEGIAKLLEQWAMENADESEHANLTSPEAVLLLEVFENRGTHTDFGLDMLDADADSTHGSVLIYALESGDPLQAAMLIQRFLLTWRPGLRFSWCLSWADTCSKPLPGSFGGGAVVVTAKGIKSITTAEWMAECVEVMDGGND